MNTIGQKKPPTKADLQEKIIITENNFKMTKELNDALLDKVKQNEAKVEALEKKNKENINTINLLGEREQSLEKINPESK